MIKSDILFDIAKKNCQIYNSKRLKYDQKYDDRLILIDFNRRSVMLDSVAKRIV